MVNGDGKVWRDAGRKRGREGELGGCGGWRGTPRRLTASPYATAWAVGASRGEPVALRPARPSTAARRGDRTEPRNRVGTAPSTRRPTGTSTPGGIPLPSHRSVGRRCRIHVSSSTTTVVTRKDCPASSFRFVPAAARGRFCPRSWLLATISCRVLNPRLSAACLITHARPSDPRTRAVPRTRVLCARSSSIVLW